MEQNNRPNFNIVTTTKSDKSIKKGLIIGALVVLFLAISIPAGVYLVRQQQDIREKAEEALVCPAAEACPVAGEPALLRSCSSIGSGQAPQDFSCSSISNVGVTASCGAVSYCCPSLGASWTTDLTLCATPSPTPTVTPTPTLTATPTATGSATASPSATASATPTTAAAATATPTSAAGLAATATPTANASSSATPMPIPATGTDWPTLVGAGLGILVIIGSILLIF
ncbi:MAG: hypothetical protein UT76_C0013G0012 [Candidatus Woesebacteria bacterium GW2011_GWB1_40_12]|uniref:Uncharacterized protein n=1 Tax=Candidatus Woesebacteria bacterium GW2011_GWB1_40_12 TaxID=1618576 RepID=A0A0G0T833_9BACT|nr:MAG: hypothetical protein UT76_C0013G0012 [Candidatus Woesebacteria bacterium GW2011_GWB1_40_12]